MSFAAIAQFAPAFFGGLIWRGANAPRRGARHGRPASPSGPTRCCCPRLPRPTPASSCNGPFGIEALRPQALFGTDGRAAEPRRAVEPVDQPAVLRARLAVARIGAAGAHPGVDLRAARRQPDAQPAAASARRSPSTTCKDTISRYLGVERTERSFQTFEARRTAQLDGNEQAEHGRHPLFRAAAGERRRLVLGAADPVAAVQARRQRLAATRSACSTTRPRRCSTTATCCRSRSTRWNRASPSSTRISG